MGNTLLAGKYRQILGNKNNFRVFCVADIFRSVLKEQNNCNI